VQSVPTLPQLIRILRHSSSHYRAAGAVPDGATVEFTSTMQNNTIVWEWSGFDVSAGPGSRNRMARFRRERKTGMRVWGPYLARLLHRPLPAETLNALID
jgi:hypothetical protein